MYFSFKSPVNQRTVMKVLVMQIMIFEIIYVVLHICMHLFHTGVFLKSRRIRADLLIQRLIFIALNLIDRF